MLVVDIAILTAETAAGDPPDVDVGGVDAAAENGHACGVEAGHGAAERGAPGFFEIAEGAVAAAPPVEREMEAVPPLVRVLPHLHALLLVHL